MSKNKTHLNNLDKRSIYSSSEILNSYKSLEDSPSFRDRDLKTAASESKSEKIRALKNQASGSISSAAYSLTSYEDYDLKKNVKTLQNIHGDTVGIMRIISDTPNKLGALSDTQKTVQSGFRAGVSYYKGERGKIYRSDKIRSERSHRRYLNSKHGEILNYKDSAINKRLSVLSIQKGDDPKKLEEYNKLFDYKRDQLSGKKFRQTSSAHKRFRNRTGEMVGKQLEEGEVAGGHEIVVTKEFASNKYIRELLKESSKLSKEVTVGAARITGKGAMAGGRKVAEVTKFNETELAKKAVDFNKDTKAKFNQGKNKFKDEIHGGMHRRTNDLLDRSEKYSKFRNWKDEKSVKIKKVKSSVSKGKEKVTGSYLGGKIGGTIKAVKDFFSALKNSADIFKTMTGIIKNIVFGFIGVYVIKIILIALAAFFIFYSFFSFLAMDRSEVPFYVNYIQEMELEYEKQIEKEIEQKVIEWEGDIDETEWNYTGKYGFSVSKEILSMAAHYNNQNWPMFNNLFNKDNPTKDYIDHLFKMAITHSINPGPPYSCDGCQKEKETTCSNVTTDDGTVEESCTTETIMTCHNHHRDVVTTVSTLSLEELIEADKNNPMEDSPIHWQGWDEDGIWIATNIYEQDWYTLYGVLVGGSGDYTPLTQEEINAYLDNIPDEVSPERKKIIESAIRGVNIIKYNYLWRSYSHKLVPGISGNPFGEPVPSDKFGNNVYGLDCSGFIIWAYWTAGYNPSDVGWGLGNTGSIYSAFGTTDIEMSEIQPGDLGLIRKTGSVGNDYNHVGIYLGNNLWVHSAGGIGANVSPVDYFKVFVSVDALN